jgi:transposase
MQSADVIPSAYLGIDVAKEKVDCVLLVDSHSGYQGFANTPAGFEQLGEWLRREQVLGVHACLEATGSYSEGLARYLVDQGHLVSVLNPALLANNANRGVRFMDVRRWIVMVAAACAGSSTCALWSRCAGIHRCVPGRSGSKPAASRPKSCWWP